MTEDALVYERLTPIDWIRPNSIVNDGRPSEASARIRHYYGARLLHRETDLYTAERGPVRVLQDRIRSRLRAARFSPDDADEWAFRNWRNWLPNITEPHEEGHDASDRVVEAALAYRDTGLPNDEAFAWTIRLVSANYAVHLRHYGWNPDAYTSLVTLCFEQAPEADEVDAWTDAPIASWRALRYLRAGLRPQEALEQERRRLDGEDIDPAIDLLIALADPDQP